MTYSLRSSASASMPYARLTKICSMYGCVLRARRPMVLAFTGVSRQPRTVRPSSRTISSRMASHDIRSWGSTGRKTMPTPYSPGEGSGKPKREHSPSKKAWGIWINTPAPLPVWGSHPQAPRCVRLIRISIPFRMMSWDFSPEMLATKPIPQASCSLRGSYRPCAFGKPWKVYPSLISNPFGHDGSFDLRLQPQNDNSCVCPLLCERPQSAYADHLQNSGGQNEPPYIIPDLTHACEMNCFYRRNKFCNYPRCLTV